MSGHPALTDPANMALYGYIILSVDMMECGVMSQDICWLRQSENNKDGHIVNREGNIRTSAHQN